MWHVTANGIEQCELLNLLLQLQTYMLSACQFFQKRSVARGPRTGLFSSQIESNEFSEL